MGFRKIVSGINWQRAASDGTHTMSTQRESFSRGTHRRFLRATRPAVLFEFLRSIPYHS